MTDRLASTLASAQHALEVAVRTCGSFVPMLWIVDPHDDFAAVEIDVHLPAVAVPREMRRALAQCTRPDLMIVAAFESTFAGASSTRLLMLHLEQHGRPPLTVFATYADGVLGEWDAFDRPTTYRLLPAAAMN